ncbi:MAG: M6 family metalloprotease domain-containing protein [Prevotella sp.]|nr:M6 family metalloprotease domain-containing protein [Prevotella sp.]
MQKVRFSLIALFSLLSLCSTAQGRRFLHASCTPEGEAQSTNLEGQSSKFKVQSRLTLQTQWDADRTYPVAVVLVAFADKAFSCDDPADRYYRMLNEEGYNEGAGPGCLAEYFVEQSGGLFHPRFDVYGPLTLASEYNANGQYGSSAFRNALELLGGQAEEADFSVYDWNGDGRAEPVIFVYAGYGGNETSTQGKGYIWPNTYTFSSITLDGTSFTGYSASAELWSNDTSCGIGTIAHEFSHTLGLPDIYPTSGSEYSVCDEWDLMDGGNYVDNGWCPPCYSAHERMLLGWFTPVELTESVTISNMPPYSEGGLAYLIPTETDTEFFLLENRQWSGWDARTPGHGLLISHVDYDARTWQNNRVNSNAKHHRYDHAHADNRDYNAWDDIVGDGDPYLAGHSMLLSGTPYPYQDDTKENRDFTDDSEPASTTYNGTGLLSKPITGIEENADGTVTFHFMGGDTSGIHSALSTKRPAQTTYDLYGRQVTAGYRGLVVRNGKLFLSTL